MGSTEANRESGGGGGEGGTQSGVVGEENITSTLDGMPGIQYKPVDHNNITKIAFVALNM